MLVTELNPQEVFRYFAEISNIPRGSGNTDKIAEYCMNFAKEHNLKARRDETNNVVIWADATKGYENVAPIMLQGHTDMVCEKDPARIIDMEKEAITLVTDGEYVWADGTTLGGDDGIAVAYILAILAADNIPHPAIEAVFTSDEETGMYGARGLDFSDIKSRRMINIDSEEEGFVYVSCAGGVRASLKFPCNKRKVKSEEIALSFKINNLTGGHSGVEIHKNRENGFILMANLVTAINKKASLGLAEINGGGKDNVIPKNVEFVVTVNGGDKEKVVAAFVEYKELYAKELFLVEKDYELEMEDAECPTEVLDNESTSNILYALAHVPNGVERMNPDVDGLVQCSSNVGIVKLENDAVIIKSLIRSNTSSGKVLLLEKITDFAEYLGANVTTESDYPAWEYKADSKLRDLMIEEYEALYRKKPVIIAMHAGLECGLFAGKVPDMDMVSVGPDLFDVHTPMEKMSVASVERTWEYIKRVLANLS